MMTLGIDLGSRKAKFAAIENNIVRWTKDFDTIAFYKKYGSLVEGQLRIDFDALNLFPKGESPKMVVTGYGRNSINLTGARVIPEIQAHVAGAKLQTDLRTFTLLDLGGQDSKVARVEDGLLLDFAMNDKCAASSGRYLENMAQILEVGLEELSLHAKDPVHLDTTCGIFGESELIGKILEGHSMERLCAGVNFTLIKRVEPMLRRFPQDQLVVTGGVARNRAFLELLPLITDAEISVPAQPQHNGALGCALIASQDRPPEH